MIEEDASDHAHVHITSKEKTRIYKCALISLIGQETITVVSSSSLFITRSVFLLPPSILKGLGILLPWGFVCLFL